MHILRHLPFRDHSRTISVADEEVTFRPYQIAIGVSLSTTEVVGREAKVFPAILDTGHSHNFSIRENQLLTWAGLRLEDLPALGNVVVNRDRVPLVEISLWIHRNRVNTDSLLPKPFSLLIPQGIAVYPSGLVSAPRLPLLGLRGLVRSGLRLTIDGDKLTVSLRN